MEYFPKEQFLILQSEAFFRDPAGYYEKTLRFLGLPEYKLSSYKKFNTGQYVSMSQNMREYLINYFRSYNESLYELLEMDFDWQK